MKKIYALFVLCLLFSACASKDKDLDMPAEDLYNLAYNNLQETKYQKAAEQFERLETEHPYSKWAVKAKLMAAYSYYKNESYDDAILATDRFLKYHPGNKDADYAYYLKGMCYYDQISSADKDQLNTRMAEETFQRLIMLYPDSKYAKDVVKRIHLAEDYKAGQEMIIGRYYLNNGNYLSALNRFNTVLEEYQKTIQIEEALYREVEIYAILGMNKYAQGYYKILKMNYPNGEWTQKADAVLSKIDTNRKPETVSKESNNSEDSSSFEWLKFGWPWFGDNKEEAETVKNEVKEEVVSKEVSKENIKSDESSSSFFSWSWPWSDNEPKIPAKSIETEDPEYEIREFYEEEGDTLLGRFKKKSAPSDKTEIESTSEKEEGSLL